MTDQGLSQAVAKMRAHGCSQAEIDGFAYSYGLLKKGASGLVSESEIEPLTSPPKLSDHPVSADATALGKTALLKLNGGLGTSMGLEKAKTLLPVREGLTFIDILVQQVLATRAAHGVRLPLMFMNSFRTHDDTLAALKAYPELPVDGLPLDFLQSQYPKVREDTLEPVEWPADPEKEWCPPGHGEVFARLESSGVLAALLERDFRYLSIANGDNLGAAPSAQLASWFAASGAPFAAEVCPRTANDRKGGHLAVRRSDGRVILRELAQTPPDDVPTFMDSLRHKFFNTNNLWVDIVALQDLMATRGTHLGLPLIRNRKTVDPADTASVPVVQLETAMGAAIEVFDGATAIEVDRGRFLPVKTTNELFLVRSDLFDLTPDRRLVPARDSMPRVDLDPRYYRLLSEFEQRVPSAPSLVKATSLKIEGDWTFGAGVEVVGDVVLYADEPSDIPPGIVLGETRDQTIAARATTVDRMQSVVAFALTGQTINLPTRAKWNGARFVVDLAAAGWDRERITSVATGTPTGTWPFALPEKIAATVSAAQLRAALNDVKERLELTGWAAASVSRRTDLTAGERRLLEDTPPHHV